MSIEQRLSLRNKMSRNKTEQIEEALQLIDPVLLAVTSQDENSRGGLIATFVSNASIVSDCPRFLVGIAKHHHTWKLIENSGFCALHLFSEEHLDWAWKLGTCSGKQTDKLADFQTTQWTTGSPILTQAVAAFDCKVESRFEIGDRTIYLLEVVEGQKLSEQTPVKYSDLWREANSEQRNLMKRMLEADQKIDRLAIKHWRDQHSTDC